MDGAIYKFNKRCILPISRENLSKIKDWRNMQMDILRQWKPLTEYNQENWFQLINQDNAQIIFAFAEISDIEDVKFIGYCGITNIDYVNRRGEISFLLDPARVKNNKLYREDFLSALYMLCQYGFDSLNVHKLFTETYTFRENHIKILEEFGLQPSGILKDHQYINGKYVDSVIHCVLQNEWLKIKESISNGLEK